MARQLAKTIAVLAVSIAALAVLAESASAQIVTGGLTGRVVDETGGVLPGVTIVVTNADTQETRDAATNDRGEYSLPSLPRGVYTVRAELAGFQPVVTSGIDVRVNEVVRTDVTLKPGGLTEAIVVTASTPLLQTQRGDVMDVVDHRTIVDLPLNGRNFVQLVALEPGAVSTAKLPGGGIQYLTATNGGNYVINGAPADGTAYLFDGMSLRDTVDTRVALRPIVDSIEEFNYQSANYSAAFGFASGGVVNVVSRSGTNTFHGTGWEFFRDDALDARNYFATKKFPFRQQQFGGVLGGPIVRSKMFFFAGYEGGRAHKGLTRVATVPTEAQRRGDFSGGPVIFNPFDVDPATGLRRAFPGNQIPAALVDPVALAALERQIPHPNRPGTTGNLVDTANQPSPSDQVSIRLDARVSQMDSVSGRYSRARYDQSIPAVQRNFGAIFNNPAQNVVVGYSRILSSSSVNSFNVGWTRAQEILIDQQQVNVAAQLGITGTNPRFLGNPGITMTGFTSPNVFASGVLPSLRDDDTIAVWDNFSGVRGSHNFSTGINLSWYRYQGARYINALGSFGFDGSFTSQLTATGGIQGGTGSSVADFLLGLPRTSSRCCILQPDAFKDVRKIDIGVYLQDDWKITSDFTLNVGLRYDYFQPPTEVLDRWSRVDYSQAPQPALQLAGKDGVSRSLRDGQDLNNVAPRANLAYALNPKTVLRGGYGVFYSTTTMFFVLPMGSVPPFTDRESFISEVRTPQLRLANAFPAGRGIQSVAFASLDPKNITPYNQNWNVTLQREIGFASSVSVSYIGNKGSNIPLTLNVNAPPPGPGPVASRRPIPAYGDDSRITNLGHSQYHGLEVRMQRRMSNGLSYLWSYVLSECIDNDAGLLGLGTGVRNPRDLSLSEGPCAYDMRHRSSANFIYELPFGRGASGFGASLVSGWQVQGILTLEGGLPFSVTLPIDNTNGAGTAYPDLVPGQDPNDGPKTPQQWLNAKAFTFPAPFSYGNAGRNIARGPGLAQVDLAVQRAFRLANNHRLDLRVEAFNLLNRANFLQPGFVWGTPSFGVVTGALDPRDVQLSIKYSF